MKSKPSDLSWEGDVQLAEWISLESEKWAKVNQTEISTTVYAWGFNDKNQLGGIEGNLTLEETKINYPLISAGANKLNPSQVLILKIV